MRLAGPRHASLASVEQEFAQAAGRAEAAGQTDQQVFYNVLSKPESRYLARQLYWVRPTGGSHMRMAI
jgi:PatG Domain